MREVAGQWLHPGGEGLVHSTWTNPVEPALLVGLPGAGEGGARQLFRVETVRTHLGAVLPDRKG